MIGIEIVDEKGHPSSDITNKIKAEPQASYACFIMWPARECASFNATATISEQELNHTGYHYNASADNHWTQRCAPFCSNQHI